MLKKLFIIAAMSSAVITSSELVAAQWEYVMIRIQTSGGIDETGDFDPNIPNSDQFKVAPWQVSYNPEVRKRIAKDGVSSPTVLKGLGEDGWELVSASDSVVSDNSRWSKLWFKRQK